MERSVQKMCYEAYQSVTNSHIYVIIIKRLKKLSNSRYLDCLLRIQENIENCIYLSPKQFVDDFTNTCSFIAKVFGCDSEIGLCILTISQVFEEKIGPILNSSDLEALSKRAKKVITEMKVLSDHYPDNIEEFTLLENSQHIICETRKAVKKSSESYVKHGFHLQRLYRLILNLKSDEEIGRITDLLLTYETQGPSESNPNSMTINLNDLDHHVLKLIWTYMQSIDKINK